MQRSGERNSKGRRRPAAELGVGYMNLATRRQLADNQPAAIIITWQTCRRCGALVPTSQLSHTGTRLHQPCCGARSFTLRCCGSISQMTEDYPARHDGV